MYIIINVLRAWADLSFRAAIACRDRSEKRLDLAAENIYNEASFWHHRSLAVIWLAAAYSFFQLGRFPTMIVRWIHKKLVL